MKNILLVFLLILNYNKANKEPMRIQKDKNQAVAALSEQLVNAMHDYISGCSIIPIGKSCYSNIRSMDTIKSDISDKKESVKILVWNKDLEIVEALSLSNYKSEEIDKFKEVVLLIHDMGESSCSNKTKKLIRRLYIEKPNASVLSLDYSSIVSGQISSLVCAILNVNSFF